MKRVKANRLDSIVEGSGIPLEKRDGPSDEEGFDEKYDLTITRRTGKFGGRCCYVIPPSMREPMGHYIVPEGGLPLSSVDYPQPGPSDYDETNVNLVKVRAPMYSCSGWPESLKDPFEHLIRKPSAEAKLEKIRQKEAKPLKQRHKPGFTIKGKSSDMNNKRIGPGPAAYFASKDCVYYRAPRPVIGKAPRRDLGSHKSCTLRQPLELYAESPGPAVYDVKYRRVGDGPKVTIIPCRADGNCVNRNPGPAHYNIKETKTSFGASLLSRPVTPPAKLSDNCPGPASYVISSSLGHAPAAVLKPDTKVLKPDRHVMPAPNAYDVIKVTTRGVWQKPEKFNFTYRPDDCKADNFSRPAPNQYSPKCTETKSCAPAYTLREKTKISYPDCINYPVDCHRSKPGPNTYSVREGILDKPEEKRRCKRGWTMAGRPRTLPPDKLPGPADYDVGNFPPVFDDAYIRNRRKFVWKSHPHSQRFKLKESQTPGPANYDAPNSCVTENKAPAFSLVSRRKFMDKELNAVGAYLVESDVTRYGKASALGKSLAGRASPLVYTGVACNKTNLRP